MDGADLCFEIVKRADAGFVYSEAVARYVICMNFPEVKVEVKEGNDKEITWSGLLFELVTSILPLFLTGSISLLMCISGTKQWLEMQNIEQWIDLFIWIYSWTSLLLSFPFLMTFIQGGIW